MTKPLVGQLCSLCRHIGADWSCAAFPGGIPSEIYLRDSDHREPVAGDRGIQFEPRAPGEVEPRFEDLMLPEIDPAAWVGIVRDGEGNPIGETIN